MKKLIAFVLVAMMVMSMAACSVKVPGTPDKNQMGGAVAGAPDGGAASQVEEPATALEVLEKTWEKYGEDEMFFAIGGMTDDGAPAADNAPGNVVLSPSDYLQYNLLVPAENVELVTDCASIMHAMNANTFTCGAYKVTDADAFVTAMQTAIQNNQWMCGFPETLLVMNVGGVIVIAFGNGEVVSTFQNHLTEAYAGAQVVINEAIG